MREDAAPRRPSETFDARTGHAFRRRVGLWIGASLAGVGALVVSLLLVAEGLSALGVDPPAMVTRIIGRDLALAAFPAVLAAALGGVNVTFDLQGRKTPLLPIEFSSGERRIAEWARTVAAVSIGTWFFVVFVVQAP